MTDKESLKQAANDKCECGHTLPCVSIERGRVIWFCGKRGYGFIDSGKDDVFVHFTAIEADGWRELRRNQMVEFERGIGANGTVQAVKVRVILSHVALLTPA